MANDPIVRSYFARAAAVGHKPLLGGSRAVLSSRFQSRTAAEAWLAVTIETNQDSGRRATGKVVPTHLPPEILAHCEGADPGVVGGKCPKCGQGITGAFAAQCVATD